jgi:hypothetical protein
MTRREVLAACLLPAVSLTDRAASALPFRGVSIIAEPHLLSRESAAAFGALLARQPPMCSVTILLPGAKHVPLRLAWQIQELAENGATVLWESGLAFSDQGCAELQRRILAQVFGLLLGQPLITSSGQAQYIAFDETRALIRPFGSTFPVFCNQGDVIAHFSGAPVCLRKKVGRGQLIYLGAMLGPHLLACDPDALRAATHLLVGQAL